MVVTTAVEWFDSNLPLPAESNVITPGFQDPHSVFHFLFPALGWTKPKSLSRKVSSLCSHICSYFGHANPTPIYTWMEKYWNLKNSHLNNIFQISNKTNIKCPVSVVCFAQTALKKSIYFWYVQPMCICSIRTLRVGLHNNNVLKTETFFLCFVEKFCILKMLSKRPCSHGSTKTTKNAVLCKPG